MPDFISGFFLTFLTLSTTNQWFLHNDNVLVTKFDTPRHSNAQQSIDIRSHEPVNFIHGEIETLNSSMYFLMNRLFIYKVHLASV